MSTLQTTRILLSADMVPILISSGAVDLFLVHLVEGQPSGALFFVMTLSAPHVIFETAHLDTASGSHGLLCQTRADAELVANPEARHDRIARELWNSALLEGAQIASEELSAEELSDPAAVTYRAMAGLVARCDSFEISETSRLLRKDEARAETVQRALGSLTAVLDRDDSFAAIPAVPQSELAAILAWIGHRQGFSFKASAASLILSGKPMQDVSAVARRSSIRYREVTLMADWWKHDVGTLLGFRMTAQGEAHSVALVRSRRGYAILQAGANRLQPLTSEVASALAPRAVMFYRPFPAEAITWKTLLRFGLFDTWRDGLVVMGIGAATGLLALVTPLAIGLLFDTIIPGAQRSQLYQMAVLLFTSNMVTFLISLSSGAAMQRMEGKMEASVQSAVWDRLLSLPVRFFSNYNSGDLVLRSLAIGEIRRTLTGTALTSMLSGVFSIFSFGLLFSYSSSLALVATALVAVTAAISVTCGWLQMRYQRQLMAIAGKISGLTLEIMTGVSKLRMSGTESQAFAQWANRFAEQKTIAARSARVSIITTVFNVIFPSVSTIAIFYFGMSMMEGGPHGLSPGSFVAFNAAFGQFLGASLGLAGTALACINVIPAYERARPILEAIPETVESQVDPGRLRGAIEASRIQFRYRPELPPVLEDVSFSIKPGQFVAFVGHSGSGKSTLFRILLGFEKPDSGILSFDDHSMEDIEPQALRRQMGVVLQSGRVFDGDLYSNIIGSAPLTIDDAWDAARAAGLDRDILAMPMGMHTVISEGGGGLSGGQRQRLLIARAIVHRPTILLFDEATSALDNQTQAIVSRSLEQLKATRLVIAHRLSTILNADMIYVLDHGRIVQQGTYDELLPQEGLFRNLAKRQIV